MFTEKLNSCVFTPTSIIWLLWKIIYVFLFDSKARGWLNYCRKFSLWHFRNSIATVFKSWHLHTMKLFRALLWVQGRYHIKSWWHAEIVKGKCVHYFFFFFKKSISRSTLQAYPHGNGKTIPLLEITMSSGNSFCYFPWTASIEKSYSVISY